MTPVNKQLFQGKAMNKLTSLTAGIALLGAFASTHAVAATFVYRKPIAGTTCATTAACAITKAGNSNGGTPAPTDPTPPSDPTPPTEQPAAFDPSVVIAQARYAARQLAAGSSLSPGSNPAQASATNGGYWQGAGIAMLSPNQYRIITLTVNPTTGALTYSVVSVPDDSDETRAAYNTYMDVTFGFSGSFRVAVSLAVKPEVCAAVSAAGQADVTCSGNTVYGTFVRPSTPVFFPNAGAFAVFGGYNLQNASAYQAAEYSWPNTGNWPY